MKIIETLKRWFAMFFENQAEKDFNAQVIKSPVMEGMMKKCADIYAGHPYWIDQEKGIKTINFAKSVCSETARLATLAIGIKIEGSARATWLQEQINKAYFQIRHWVEYGCAYGTVFVKPNGKGFDVFTPLDVLLTDCDNQEIRGIIFRDQYTKGEKYYTRLEYHRFVDSTIDGMKVSPYYISNRTYVSSTPDSIGKPVAMADTIWADLLEDTPPILKRKNESLDGPMFGVFRTPQANNLDLNTAFGLPIYAEAIEELKDLDVAYSRNVGEIYDSEKIILADDRLLMPSGVPLSMHTAERMRDEMKLPHYVKNVYGQEEKEFYQEINPQLNTETRIAGINALLSQLGYKIGFSNGYFVFNESNGIQTATGVEAEQQRTIQFIKDVRDKLEACIDGAIYALNAYADLYELAPSGTYETNYNFGDITYSYEEDKKTWWSYVNTGKVPFWYYLVKFEGFTKEDAKALADEAQSKQDIGLFGDE